MMKRSRGSPCLRGLTTPLLAHTNSPTCLRRPLLSALVASRRQQRKPNPAPSTLPPTMINHIIKSASTRFHMHAYWPTTSTCVPRGGLTSAGIHHYPHPSSLSTTIPSSSMARPAAHLCRSAEYVSPLPPKRANPPRNTLYRRCSQPTPIEHTKLTNRAAHLHTGCTALANKAKASSTCSKPPMQVLRRESWPSHAFRP